METNESPSRIEERKVASRLLKEFLDKGGVIERLPSCQEMFPKPLSPHRNLLQIRRKPRGGTEFVPIPGSPITEA